MKQSFQLRLGQSLTMTPQLQQAIRLLQLSTMELNVEVQQALESNMMLESVDESEEFGTVDERPESASETEEFEVQANGGRDSESNEVEGSISDEIPDELPVDSAWEDIYDSATTQSSGSSGESTGFEFDNQRSSAGSLKDHLLWQLNLSPMTETDRVIALALVDALNSDGYLLCDLTEITEALGRDAEIEVELDEVEAVLHRIQSLDPIGVGARNLGECLLLQLGQCCTGTAWLAEARRLVSDYLDLLAAHDYNQIARRLNVTKDELQKIVALIQAMNPRPGAHLEEARVEYVVPDVYVRKRKGQWQVELNVDAIPQLRVNPYYASMIKRADNSPDNVSLKTHLQEARWFIKSLQSRSETLLKVATAIVERQRAFLDHGEEAMKPLVLHDIAEVLGMHESTISRVTTRKYMHTPRGIYELKFFFSSHLSTSVGGECSSTAIRAVIKKMIAAENPIKPLSDSKIAAVLCEQGIQVARRTVAKYREAMTIPPSNERKRLV
jgi:RNA polymerase sigma-54 factor